IVNACGSMADLPEDAVLMVPEDFVDTDLITALETLWKDPQKRFALSRRAREVILERHSPRACAEQYARAIENYYDRTQSGRYELIQALGKLEPLPSNDCEWLTVAQKIALNRPRLGNKQLLIDVSVISVHDEATGIQRVCRSILSEFLAHPPDGFRVEPVYAKPGQLHYRYARQYTLDLLDCPKQVFVDDPVEIFNGDVFLGPDLAYHLAVEQTDFFAQMRRSGGEVYFIVHDLLPVLMPDKFEEGNSAQFDEWLQTVAMGNGAICVSRSLADEMRQWLNAHSLKHNRPFKLGWFHLGADVEASFPTRGLPEDAAGVIDKLRSRPTFLVVAWIDPRKGQKQILAAFERLWDKGLDVNLVMAGKCSWKKELVQNLRSHPEHGKHFFWLGHLSDEYLAKVYVASTCLIAGSEGEGFGLPLVEAARHKLPIIARDIPVFREVAGEHAFYFSGLQPEPLANAVKEWMALFYAGQAPQSEGMKWLTWKESTQDLLEIFIGGNWQQVWEPETGWRIFPGGTVLRNRRESAQGYLAKAP
ncbi:MAG: glycosyltransferase, partial [Syntrophobacteraceae bacterium]